MPSLSDRTFASYFKNLLTFNQSANAGVTSSTVSVQDGKGSNSAISLSDDQLLVKPQSDDTTSAVDCQTSGGNSILKVDTTNKRVLCGSSQVNALTMYKTFVTTQFSPDGAGSHMVLAQGSSSHESTGLVEVSLGSDTDPATTLDVSEEAAETYRLIPLYWYLPDAITIMSATVLMGTDNATDNALNFHLMSYDIDTSTNYGDLSNGVVIADSGTTSAVDEDVIKVASMTNLPTDVAAGKVILATVESDATNRLGIQMIIKYHIQ